MGAFAEELYNKHLNGDSIDDEDLVKGIEFFKDITNKLDALGPTFRHSANECRRVLINFQNFDRARKESAKEHKFPDYALPGWLNDK